MSMFDRIVEYASRQLEIPAEEITRDTTFESLGAVSYTHLDVYKRQDWKPCSAWWQTT